MKRTKLKDRILPIYTKGEEIFNMTSHIVGAAFGAVALISCLIVSAYHKDVFAIVSSIVYGISVIILYTMSSIYHGLGAKTNAKKVFQVLDHCSIFLLIAGSYTPFCLVMFREYDPKIGWLIFSIIWAMAILGIVLNSIDIKKYKKLSMICYLVMGWCIILKANLLPELIGKTGFALLVSGGVAYSLGAILYGLGKKKKYIHSVFHLFVVLGTILQYLCIIIYVL